MTSQILCFKLHTGHKDLRKQDGEAKFSYRNLLENYQRGRQRSSSACVELSTTSWRCVWGKKYSSMQSWASVSDGLNWPNSPSRQLFPLGRAPWQHWREGSSDLSAELDSALPGSRTPNSQVAKAHSYVDWAIPAPLYTKCVCVYMSNFTSGTYVSENKMLEFIFCRMSWKLPPRNTNITTGEWH